MAWIEVYGKINLLYLFRISLFTKNYLQNYYEHVIKIKFYYHKSTKIRKILKAETNKINYYNEIFKTRYFAAWQHRD